MRASKNEVADLKTLGLPSNSALQDILDNGNEAKAKADLDNAQKRERIIAATELIADEAALAGQMVLISGDWNTSFEPGKFGHNLDDDCHLKPFSCEKAPFPADACADGDGYDDTFAILTVPLIGTQQYQVLTEGLGRTFKDSAFADRAIDHMAVPIDQAGRWTLPHVATDSFGSDHFPIYVTFHDN